MPVAQISDFSALPIPDNNRKCTDVFCTIVAVIFALTMFIVACCLFSRYNLTRLGYPTDATGRTCGQDLPLYPFAYFANPMAYDPNIRVCVSTCPRTGDTTVDCAASSELPCNSPKIIIYDSAPVTDRLGAYCRATDPVTNTQVLVGYNLKQKFNFFGSLDTILISMAIAFGAGVIFFVFVQILPKIFVWIVIVLAALEGVALSVLLFTDNNPSFVTSRGWVITIGILLLILALGLLVNAFFNSHHVRLCSIFIKQASLFINQNLTVFFYIPLFIIFSFGLVTLIVFQHLAFAGNKSPSLTPGDVYLNGTNFNFGILMNFVELIWGISFLRDAFNFVISGNAAHWYFTPNSPQGICTPFSRLLRWNFGSVVGGSFVNALLFLPDVILNILRCTRTSIFGPLINCCGKCCNCFTAPFQLVRADAYSYINLACVPYCDAARQCEYLCQRSRMFSGSQSINKIYRISAHLLLLTLVLFVAYAISKGKLIDKDVSVATLIYITIGCFMIIPYFICIHADAADALMITFLAEERLDERGFSNFVKAPNDLKHEVEQVVGKHNTRSLL